MNTDDILDMVEGEECYNPEELDEKAVLGDDEEDHSKPVKKEEIGEDADDLYDAAIEPSGVVEKRESAENPPTPSKTSYQHQHSSTGTMSNSNLGKRYCCYIGNMTWWTTDNDLSNLIKSFDVDDLVDIKFYENRNNGQSKGFALAVFASEPSVKTVMEKLPSRKLHEQTLAVLPYNKQSLAKFEDATKRVEQKDKKDDMKTGGMVNIGTVRIGAPNPVQSAPLVPSINLGLQLAQIQQQGVHLNANSLQLRQALGQSTMGMQPLMQQQQRQQINLSGPPPNMQQQHMNAMNRHTPGFPQQINTSGPPPNTGMRTSIPPPGIPGMPHFAQNFGHAENGVISEAEFDEIMNRNRTVSSSAISRAVSDAAAGDYGSAIETLVTAISLIRQSRVSNDDRCKVLITALQDTLQGIESKSYNSSSRKHRSGRERSRSPSDRSMRKRHRRTSRSRSRSRDRYDYSPPRHSSTRLNSLCCKQLPSSRHNFFSATKPENGLFDEFLQPMF
uniref:RRM domain-containing protein n=1 Tax=Ditylenchus dipsaci TaxID=166011 RepID=A0A915CVD6_9BILA